MTDSTGQQVLSGAAPDIAERLALSALSPAPSVVEDPAFRAWFRQVAEDSPMAVTQLPLSELDGWVTRPDGGDVEHVSGKFFRVTGLEINDPQAPVASWSQPILDQPEVGILGILVQEFDGVLHCLIQAKAEPGNVNGLQLSPTVQATRSNYTRVHGGNAVPYLEHFRSPGDQRVVADVLHSEQGSWFYQKRNRNMVVEVTEDIPALPGFRWVSLRQVYELLGQGDLVNMDTRTVLSCLPLDGATLSQRAGAGSDEFTGSIHRSLVELDGGASMFASVLSWITDQRARSERSVRAVPLDSVARGGWRRTDDRIHHDSERFFSIVGVGVNAQGREVRQWSQPMLMPHGQGLAAMIVASIDGVLHALMQATVAPGYLDSVEVGPTVQCTPDNLRGMPPERQPLLLEQVLHASWDRLRFDTVLSEEGGRFYNARTRYLICELTPEEVGDLPPEYRWLTLAQIAELLRHSHYVNVEARTLVACLHSLAT